MTPLNKTEEKVIRDFRKDFLEIGNQWFEDFVVSAMRKAAEEAMMSVVPEKQKTPSGDLSKISKYREENGWNLCRTEILKRIEERNKQA